MVIISLGHNFVREREGGVYSESAMNYVIHRK